MSDDMTFDEVVDHIMRVTGKSRRAARRELIEAAKAGKITTYSPDGNPISLADLRAMDREH